MQLDQEIVEQPGVNPPPPVTPPAPSLPPLKVRAFGQSLLMTVTSDIYLRDDSYWRLRSIYEPALCAQTMAATGVALDIGAGFGCFAVPFAMANRGWTVWAFEPEPAAFAALSQNIQTNNLTNVHAINAAVAGPTGNEDWAKLVLALTEVGLHAPGDAKAMAALRAQLAMVPFRQHTDMPGIVEIGTPHSDAFEARTNPCIPSEALLCLNPSLLKLTAPFAENAVLTGLIEAKLDHIIGESWSHVEADLVYGRAAGLRQTWIPRAGEPMLRLRRSIGLTGHRPGLDVVVAMYNAQAWIKDCVDGILDGAGPDVRVLVVDDGSTDGSGDVVRAAYPDTARVVLLTKLNGGCASARNYGRLNSDASHIAFVDADDVPGPGLFGGLLDLARHTGAEVVQGGFDLMHQNPDGTTRLEPSYEADLPPITTAHRHPFGPGTCRSVPSEVLIQGQPSIWRRAYRRDFLDNRNIWFPEHIRAFDDQIFQVLTLQQVRNVPMLDGVAYHYRQHPAQDIKQGDERSFYSLEMFRMILRRGVTEGWQDFRPTLQSFVNTVNWCWTGLRPDLRPAFERGAAELWVYAQNALDPAAFDGLPDTGFAPPDFAFHVRTLHARMAPLNQSYGNVYLDSVDMHTSMIKAARLV